MLKTLIQPQPPCPLAPLSPASLTDKPLGAGGRGSGSEQRGLRCVWMHVYLHEVCQQVSRGAGMSANSRSTWHTRAQVARGHARSHNSVNPPTVDALKGGHTVTW